MGIFEPVPVLIADLDNIRSIKESIVGEIEEIADKPFKSEIFIISRQSSNFRAVLGGVVKLKSGGLKISGVAAAALKLRLGDKIRFVSFRAKEVKKKKVTKKK